MIPLMRFAHRSSNRRREHRFRRNSGLAQRANQIGAGVAMSERIQQVEISVEVRCSGAGSGSRGRWDRWESVMPSAL